MTEVDAELEVDEPEALVEDEAESAEDVLPFRYKITSYGSDYPVDALVKRIQSGAIEIPRFQRGYVWSKNQADRFIESLLLDLPVPGIFLAREQEGSALLVIDGLQRLRTLQYFYEERFENGRPFVLANVQEEFQGLSYSTLSTADRTRLDDQVIHATIVRQDEPTEDESSVYFVFERINTGGTPLSSQEIRVALYQGAFNDLLGSLNENPDWRELYGPVSNRMKDQELILRFFALLHDRAHYARPMKGFLNNFMARNRDLKGLSADRIEREFSDAVRVIRSAIGKTAFRPRAGTNTAVFDSVMVGVATRLRRGPVHEADNVLRAYLELLNSDNYQAAYTRATADEERVATRLDLAIAAFADV